MPEKKMFTATFRVDGKRYYVRSTAGQRDADKRAAIRETEIREGRDLISENMPAGDYIDKWAETYKEHIVSKSVYSDYKTRIAKYIKPAIGNMRMRDIRPTHLQKILNKQAGKSKSHCSKLRVTLEGIFSQAVKDRVVIGSPAADLMLPKATDGTHRSITEEERAAILNVAETHRFGTFVKTILLCGLRPQEVVALQWRDIDQINHRVIVSRALKKSGEIAEPKSASGVRTVPIPPALQTALTASGDLGEYIFTTTKNERHSHTSIKRGWDSFKREVDIMLGAKVETYYNKPMIAESVVAKDLTMYCLRHTYCTDLEAAGVPINVAKYLMGHSSIELTSRIYTHIRNDTLETAAHKVALFGSTSGATTGATTKGKTSAIEGLYCNDSENTDKGKFAL